MICSTHISSRIHSRLGNRFGVFERQETIEHFSERWTPKDQREIHHVHTDLHVLVRQIYADAQRPVVDTMTNLIPLM